MADDGEVVSITTKLEESLSEPIGGAEDLPDRKIDPRADYHTRRGAARCLATYYRLFITGRPVTEIFRGVSEKPARSCAASAFHLRGAIPR